MIDPLLLKAGWVLALVILYGLLRWRLMVATHDFRARVGCEADRWADDERLDGRTRAVLSDLADRAYRPTTPWLILLGVVIVVFLPPRGTSGLESLDDDIAREIIGLLGKLFLAMISTSPLACVLASFVLLIDLLVLRSVDKVVAAVPVMASRFFAKSAGMAYSHSR